jgi:hypothetical protein
MAPYETCIYLIGRIREPLIVASVGAPFNDIPHRQSAG